VALEQFWWALNQAQLLYSLFFFPDYIGISGFRILGPDRHLNAATLVVGWLISRFMSGRRNGV
jgi:hypothetical protein